MTRRFLVYLFFAILLVVNQAIDVVRSELSQTEKEFSEFDINRDGYIDAQEIRIIRTSVTLQELHQFFWEIDVDSSGTISFHEYSNFVTNNSHAHHSESNNQHS
ncbi:EF-hand domain pair family protein [Cryptosporidium meleagridis]|uniref:EF-hand domain pair family protein n=1 Tax=Cryptosporidium meleagridis TaxID=93969 RepID=A0A2P4YZ80_9CRYT|nr:EF-hand domain pair family protein [Cryptosporidium meleagridis]